ncbi:MAG: PEP-CTERM sorting domain-containing protein, partial [Flavobacteriales bacterium]|nr:PEP-CTERM sorting domain-containing protein [Flavobacteriales bacterium]
NHPDGGIAPPLYGFRLDGLLGDPAKEYTFDFDHSGSNMTLTWDGSKIVIDGTAFGGEDIGGGYKAGTTDLWNIHFEYKIGISQSANGGLIDLVVHADNQNFGTISSSFGSWELEDQSNNNQNTGLAFQLGDEDGGGHRGFSGISGWGWVNHGANCISGRCDHIYSSDWLFTAEKNQVPLPATIWLFGIGLLGLTVLNRGRSRI